MEQKDYIEEFERYQCEKERLVDEMLARPTVRRFNTLETGFETFFFNIVHHRRVEETRENLEEVRGLCSAGEAGFWRVAKGYFTGVLGYSTLQATLHPDSPIEAFGISAVCLGAVPAVTNLLGNVYEMTFHPERVDFSDACR